MAVGERVIRYGILAVVFLSIVLVGQIRRRSPDSPSTRRMIIVCGVILALFAVGLAIYGLTRPR